MPNDSIHQWLPTAVHLLVAGAFLLQSHCFAQERAAAGQAILDEMRQRLESGSTRQLAPATGRLSEPVIRPHRAHGKKPFDYTREMLLTNQYVTYRLKYWTNAGRADGGDPTAIEGSTGLGMDKPSTANWYSNNFFEFRYGTKELLRHVLPEFSVDTASGADARILMCWQTPGADVELALSLGQEDLFLTIHCQVVAHGEQPQPVTLGFRAYPGHYPKPHARYMMSRLRQVAAPARIDLAPDESRIVLFDQNDPATCCVADFAASGATTVALDMQTYGTTLKLSFAPASSLKTGPILLWDVPHTPLNETMSQLFSDGVGIPSAARH